jgi:hypothetical protein
MRHTSALILSLVLIACGGASRAPTTPDDDEVKMSRRDVIGTCMANYLPDSDVTVIVLEVPGVGLVGVPALGDGWSIDCRVEGNRLVMAENTESARWVTVVVDPGGTELPNVAAYADAHAKEIAAQMGKNDGVADLRMSEPTIVDESTYVLFVAVVAEGRRFGQLNAFALAATPVGLFRYHVSELSDEIETLKDHAEALIISAQAFEVVSEEELAAED